MGTTAAGSVTAHGNATLERPEVAGSEPSVPAPRAANQDSLAGRLRQLAGYAVNLRSRRRSFTCREVRAGNAGSRLGRTTVFLSPMPRSHSLLLIRIDGDALEVVIGHSPMQQRSIKGVVRQALFQAGDRATGCRVRMHDAMRALDISMDRAMDNRARAVDRKLARPRRVALDVNGHETGCGHFVILKTKWIDQEHPLRPGARAA